jgi:ubiquinone/menaquinone biosynthesis C-methylase UbiE
MPPDSVTFNQAADFYDETRGFPPGEEAHVGALVARAGQLTRTSRVLEVGIGTGRIALPLATHVRAVLGIDLARPMLERLIAKRTVEPVFVAEGDATRLPFPARIFDAAVAAHVFHLIPAWQAALAEVARVLRPAGRLISNYYEREGQRRGIAVLWEAWEAAVPAGQQRNVGVPREQYGTYLTDAGWRPAGEKLAHTYVQRQTARAFLDRLERRVWSSMWRLSDDDFARGLAAVRAEIERRGLDLDAPVETEARFIVEAYLPPAR